MKKTYYEILGITQNATKSTMLIALKQKINQIQLQNNEDKETMKQQVDLLLDVYNVLTNHKAKKEYDAYLHYQKIGLLEQKETDVYELMVDMYAFMKNPPRFQVSRENHSILLTGYLIAQEDQRFFTKQKKKMP